MFVSVKFNSQFNFRTIEIKNESKKYIILDEVGIYSSFRDTYATGENVFLVGASGILALFVSVDLFPELSCVVVSYAPNIFSNCKLSYVGAIYRLSVINLLLGINPKYLQ